MICPMIGKRATRADSKFAAPFRQIDRILDVPGDDEVGIAGPAAPRERVDEVRDRPSLLGLQGFDEPRHRRAVEARAHRPEDVLARRPSTERPALREVRRAYRLAPVVLQGRGRRPVAPAERAVALHAAGLLVELLPELDGFLRRSGALGSGTGAGLFRVGEVGGEGLDEVREIRDFLVGEVGPGRHRRVRHAALDDVDNVLMRRQRSGGRRANLELAAVKSRGLGRRCGVA